MARILVVDDEEAIVRALSTNLRAREFQVDLASTGEQALRLVAERHPDLVILDLGLPGIDGLEVLRGLRGWTTVPIVVLSARTTEEDKVGALDLGADDYLTKPFGMGELLARVRAALRRAAPVVEEATIVTEHFTVDLGAKQVLDPEDRVVHLTPTEWHVLEVLVHHRGKLVTGSMLTDQVWGPDYGDASNSLRVHLAHLRRKLEPDPANPSHLLTEPGMGYRFES